MATVEKMMRTSRFRLHLPAFAMRAATALALSLSIAATTAHAQVGAIIPPFSNPVVPFDCPDPGILAVTDPEPTYYMVCTGGSFPIRRSYDMVRWEDTGSSILPSGRPAWAANGGRNWAPELHQVGDRFIAYYTSVNGSNVLSIGAAWADHPLGPYTDLGRPLVVHSSGVIDANYFRDDDGRHYLFVKIDGNSHGGRTPILVARLAPDGLSFETEFTEVLSNDRGSWEGGVVEASWTVKRGSYYYLFYSGNVYDGRYRTGVARATSVTGPYVKYGPPILGVNGQFSGPGHGSVVRVGDEDWFFYHAWNAVTGAGRFGMLDRITWGGDGWPRIGAGSPTVGAQARPTGTYGIPLLNELPVSYGAPSTTDIDGDGRSDVCARSAAGVQCWPATESGWGEPWAPIPWTDSNGWNHPTHYATLRMGDVDGDGRADVCARSSTDFLCSTSNGSGFDAYATWREGTSNANGWNLPRYYTGMRLADVNGDRRDDLCARDSVGFGCWLSNGNRFDERIEGPRWADASGFALPQHYGTLRMGDLDADGLADVCIRGAAGIECALSDGEGFPTEIVGPRWADAQGFGAIQYWSTLRMADVNGDRRADLCIRTATDLRCHFSTGDAFSDAVIVDALSDANGWSDITNYATLRTGDIDGDGATDLCARANNVVICWAWSGTEFSRVDGPELSDASGWGAGPQYYETIRLADFDGDGMADLCARAGVGWICHPSRGDSFGEAVALGELADSGGWAARQYFTTIMSAGVACIAEIEACNGEDDDCDGAVDEEVCSIGSDGGTNPDAGSSADAGDTPDGGTAATPQPGCACRVGTADDESRAWLCGFALVLGLVWRRQRGWAGARHDTVAAVLLRISRAIQTVLRDAARTRRACGI